MQTKKGTGVALPNILWKNRDLVNSDKTGLKRSSSSRYPMMVWKSIDSPSKTDQILSAAAPIDIDPIT